MNWVQANEVTTTRGNVT
ncbi:hypothetical protein D037_0951A, partial [Vibrio parahaemolyticus IDH02640]